MSASSSSDREIGGVEDVLGVDAQGELRGDGQYGRKGEYRRRRGPEQQAQGEGGYERAQRVEPLAGYGALAQPLGGERAGDDQGNVGWRLVEAERADAVNQQERICQIRASANETRCIVPPAARQCVVPPARVARPWWPPVDASAAEAWHHRARAWAGCRAQSSWLRWRNVRGEPASPIRRPQLACRWGACGPRLMPSGRSLGQALGAAPGSARTPAGGNAIFSLEGA
jgi:hypothetical protein